MCSGKLCFKERFCKVYFFLPFSLCGFPIASLLAAGCLLLVLMQNVRPLAGRRAVVRGLGTLELSLKP